MFSNQTKRCLFLKILSTTRLLFVMNLNRANDWYIFFGYMTEKLTPSVIYQCFELVTDPVYRVKHGLTPEHRCQLHGAFKRSSQTEVQNQSQLFFLSTHQLNAGLKSHVVLTLYN